MASEPVAAGQRPPRRIAIANQKGGVGKTTTAVNLGAELARTGHRVLVVDLDPQRNASRWLRVPVDGRGLYDFFRGEVGLQELVTPTAIAGMSAVPGSQWLVSADQHLAGEVGVQGLLRSGLDTVPDQDIVLLDCPPSLGLLLVAALVAAHEALVPVETTAMPLEGLADLTHTIQRVQERVNPDLRLNMILPCRVERGTTLSQNVIERLRRSFNDAVMDTIIRKSVRLAEAPSHRQPIYQYAPGSSGDVDYRLAARELLQRGQMMQPKELSS